MSKKINVTEETAIPANVDTQVEELTMVPLRDYFEKYPNVSIRKLAAATEVTYGILLKKSKEPIPNVPYDPSYVNYAAVTEALVKRGIKYDELDWESMNTSATSQGPSVQKSMDAFKVGDKVYLRRHSSVPYDILYLTDTHVVIMLQGSTEPQAWSHSTFLINGPVFEPRAVKNSSTEVEEVAEESGEAR